MASQRPHLCNHERGSISDSAFHGHGYATDESRRIFCDVCRLQRWLDIEGELAASQAELGLIPAEAAEHIRAAAHIDRLDQEAIRRGIQETGHSLVPLLRALGDAAGSFASQYVHYGATTQDIQDTAQALEMKEVLDLAERDCLAILDLLEPYAIEHKLQLMMGRTHAQPALPTTVGLKFAGWIDELTRHVERVREARKRVLVAQLHGGVGTMASFGGRGPELLERFARRLELAVPAVCWHVIRDRVSEFVFLLSSVTASLGRIADEIRTLTRPEVSELEEFWQAGNIGSSTMPHKRNPERSEQVVVLARMAKAQMVPALEAMVVEHERDYRATRLEWPAVIDVSHYGLRALSLTRDILAQIRVRTEVMETAAAERADSVCTEALMFAIGQRIGKAKAFRLIHSLSQEAIDEGQSLRDRALESPELRAVMDESAINLIFDPASYLGASESLVDAAIAKKRQLCEETDAAARKP